MANNDNEVPALSESASVKVRVRFLQEDGWPPFASEVLWATPLPGGTYRLKNIPFFAMGISLGDEISVRKGADGLLWFKERLRRGGRLTVRVTAAHAGDTVQAIMKEFAPLSISGEGMDSFQLVALDIGPETDWAAAKARLHAGQESGRWWYEESDVNLRWASL